MSYWKCKNCGEDCCVNSEISSLRASLLESQAREMQLREALEFYARGAVDNKPKKEKEHLYVKDFAMNTPEWRARSMSDYESGGIAKEALSTPPPPIADVVTKLVGALKKVTAVDDRNRPYIGAVFDALAETAEQRKALGL